MKRIHIGWLCLALLLGLTGCGNQQAEPKAVSGEAMIAAVSESQAFEELTSLEQTQIETYLGLSEGLLTDAALAMDASRATPERIIALTASDADSLAAVKEALARYVEGLKAEYRDYRPEEMPKLENAVLLEQGLQLVLVISADPAAAEQAVKAAWQEA